MKLAAEIVHHISLPADNAGCRGAWSSSGHWIQSETSWGHHPASLPAASQAGRQAGVGSDTDVATPPQVPTCLLADQDLRELVSSWLLPRLPGRHVTPASLWHRVL